MRFNLSHLGFLYMLLILLGACRDKDNSPVQMESIEHPRILLLSGEEQIISELVATDEVWKKMHSAILKEANKILAKPLLERVMIGRRLLSTSRECLRRIFYLSYAYRMSLDDRFLNRAEEEMLAVSAFSDWNPSHFLDVAEMTMALAIGYDWLYPVLADDSKTTISHAIAKKGLEPSYDGDYNWFLRSSNNWNQVCNAGMTYGALAIEGEYPELARATIDRAMQTIGLPMKDYGPDGAYPEGYGYWGYGTSFNVMFLSAIDRIQKKSHNLLETPGFLETADFLQHMLTPTGPCYNWGDNGLGGSLKPAMFWFAEKRADPSLLWSENKFLQIDNYSKFTRDRLLPAIMIWGKHIPLGQITEPSAKFWVGQGKNPVALMRTSWTDPNALYVGCKAGSPSVNHGHMDIGSFIMEADGVRWVSDFGSQNYESLESKGLSIFGKSQDAQRWTIFRMNNFAHSTLTVNDKLQRVSGYAKIDRYSDATDFSYAISDISSVYDGQLRHASRGIGIKEESYVIVRDEISTLDKETKVRWNLVTFADVALRDDGATLTEQGQKLFIDVISSTDIEMKTWSTAPTNDYDAENPGSIMLGFETVVAADAEEFFEVLLVPEKSRARAVPLKLALKAW